jgi:hypothetical protein
MCARATLLLNQPMETMMKKPALSIAVQFAAAIWFTTGLVAEASAQTTGTAANRAEANPSLLAPTAQVRSLQALSLNNGAPAVAKAGDPLRLNHSFVAGNNRGTPSHYRASRRPDFSGAMWTGYVQVPEFRIANANSQTTAPGCDQGLFGLVLYFQVRYTALGESNVPQKVGTAKAVATGPAQFTDSNVVSDTICVPIDGR